LRRRLSEPNEVGLYLLEPKADGLAEETAFSEANWILNSTATVCLP
jgi:hypothetical protein